MSIDARIAAVTVITETHCELCGNTGKDANDWDDCPRCHGAVSNGPLVRLALEPREKGGLAGQPVLTIVNPPATRDLSGLIGIEIWGGSGSIMIGEHTWAERIGYTRIRLVP